MVFIVGLLLMWIEYYHDLRYDKEDAYMIVGLLGRIMCSVSLIHFAWYVLL